MKNLLSNRRPPPLAEPSRASPKRSGKNSPTWCTVAAACILCVLAGRFGCSPPEMQWDAVRPSSDAADTIHTTSAVAGSGDADSIASWHSLHELGCRGFAHGLPTKEDVFVETTTPEPFSMNIHDPSKDVVSSHIHRNGCWECDHVRGMLEALEAHPRSYFLDVGGNIGMWTLTAAAAGIPTVTIEPSVENYSRICKTVHRNGWQNSNRFHLLTVGASDAAATFRLNVPSGNKGGTSLVAAAEADPAAEGVIQTVPIDSLHLPTDRPVVMKVDVEGHELKALLGARGFLRTVNLVYLAIELRPLSKGTGWEEIFAILLDKGLKPFRVVPSGWGSLFEAPLDPTNLSEWKHPKHPKVRYYDVVWKK